jgi:MFS family permease
MADPSTNNHRAQWGIVSALRHRNYRLFFAGQSVSLIGTWMQRIAMGWLIYRLTGSALLLGVFGFVGQIPMLFLAPFVGVFVERWDKQKVLVVTQIASLVQALLLAILTFTHQETYPVVLVLGFFLGVVNTIDMPARQSFVVEMLEEKRDLPNALALNSFVVNCGKLIGPTLAGFIIALVGESWCFLINAISYVGVVFAINAMRVAKKEKNETKIEVFRELTMGFRYVFGQVHLRSVILMIALLSLVGAPYTDLLPIVAKELLHGGSHTFGFLRAAPGVGAIIGGLWLASRNSVRGLARVVPVACMTFGIALIGFSYSRSLPLSLTLLAISGLGMMVQLVSSNTMVQSCVSDDMRGRTMSIYAMAMQGTMPLGSLTAGYIASRLGVPTTFVICGACCVAGSIVFTMGLQKWKNSSETAHLVLRRDPKIIDTSF